MLTLYRSKQAEEDLIAIWGYIAHDNPAAADALLIAIDERCALLTQFPGMGSERPDLRKGLRHSTIGSYLILYRIKGKTLEVARVVHGARVHYST